MADVVARGVDISSHQGEIDFAKVRAAGYSYVIIKAGQGLREFQTFRGKYLPAVLAAGLDWGAYWWSDAVTVDEARREAEVFVAALGKLRPTYPVYMDQEYDSPCGQWGLNQGKQTRTDMAAAVVTAGYADGIPRSLSGSGAHVLIHGQRAPVIGRICMDQLLADVSGIVGVKQGDVVTLIGRDGSAEIRCEDFAGWCGTISNEILCRLGGRLGRIYLP